MFQKERKEGTGEVRGNDDYIRTGIHVFEPHKPRDGSSAEDLSALPTRV
jgi:hypothetical protein